MRNPAARTGGHGNAKVHRSLSQFKGVKPAGDRVLVKVDKEEGKTVGGVLLPTVAQNKPTAGAVVALGEVQLVQVRSGQQCLMPRMQIKSVSHGYDGWQTCITNAAIAIGINLPSGARTHVIISPPEQSNHTDAGRLMLVAQSASLLFDANKSHTINQLPPYTVSATQSGDRVVYSKYAGTEVAISGDEHVLLKVRRQIELGMEAKFQTRYNHAAHPNVLFNMCIVD